MLPYLLPFALLIYPLVCLGRKLDQALGRSGAEVEEVSEVHRSAAKTSVIVATSYIISYTPMAIMSVGVFPAFLRYASRPYF